MKRVGFISQPGWVFPETQVESDKGTKYVKYKLYNYGVQHRVHPRGSNAPEVESLHYEMGPKVPKMRHHPVKTRLTGFDVDRNILRSTQPVLSILAFLICKRLSLTCTCSTVYRCTGVQDKNTFSIVL